MWLFLSIWKMKRSVASSSSGIVNLVRKLYFTLIKRSIKKMFQPMIIYFWYDIVMSSNLFIRQDTFRLFWFLIKDSNNRLWFFNTVFRILFCRWMSSLQHLKNFTPAVLSRRKTISSQINVNKRNIIYTFVWFFFQNFQSKNFCSWIYVSSYACV